MTVILSKLYTKNGDRGQTQLAGGTVVSKADKRVKAYGEIDELNAALAAAIASDSLSSDNPKTFVSLLAPVQQLLFDIGAELASAGEIKQPAVNEKDITDIEKQIDAQLEGLAPLTSFVLPGGSLLNAQLHLARTICRRAERSICELNDSETVSSHLMIYINRLSDLLFACCRRERFLANGEEVLWIPKAKRQSL